MKKRSSRSNLTGCGSTINANSLTAYERAEIERKQAKHHRTPGAAILTSEQINGDRAPAVWHATNSEKLQRAAALRKRADTSSSVTADRLRREAHALEMEAREGDAPKYAANLRERADVLERTGDATPFYTTEDSSRACAERIAANLRKTAREIEATDARETDYDNAGLYAQRQANGFAYCTQEDGERLTTYETPYSPVYIEIYERAKTRGDAIAHFHLKDHECKSVGTFRTAPSFYELQNAIAQEVLKPDFLERLQDEVEEKHRAAEQVQAERMRRGNGH